jgi:hypothetical protein
VTCRLTVAFSFNQVDCLGMAVAAGKLEGTLETGSRRNGLADVMYEITVTPAQRGFDNTRLEIICLFV